MKYTHFLFIACFCLSFTGMAQNQYGLVIGINRYYKLVNGQKVLDAENSKLKGCVSDAKAVKQLLVDRFGFAPGQIREVYDFEATEDRIRQEIKDLLAKCKPGDAAVVYYSGHGFSFPHIDPKTGTQWAEAICTADFNATPDLRYNYIQGSELAYLFGQFVDEDITLTALFDCCHSNSTVRLQKPGYSLTGIRKILSPDAWVQMSEPDVNMAENMEFVMYEWILQYGAMDLVVECDGQGNTGELKAWLDRHGDATLKADPACQGPLTWTHEEESSGRGLCSDQVKEFRFYVTDTCGHMESTKATFTIRDSQSPEIVVPARDTTIVCCGQDHQAILKNWTGRQGGAQVRDICSLSWSDDLSEQKRTDLQNTGEIKVTFTATDGCHPVSTSARFIVEDLLPVRADSLNAAELELVLKLLNGMPFIRGYLTESSLPQQNPEAQVPGGQLAALLDSIDNYRIPFLTSYTSDSLPELDMNGHISREQLETLQGTPTMQTLVGHIRDLLALVDPVDLRPFDNRQLPLDFLYTSRPDMDLEAFLNTGGSTVAKELVLVTADPKQFPFTSYAYRPPSKIPGSDFLFMCATDDVQRGVEKKDENRKPRGAFTKALISVLRDGPADQSAVTIFEKVKQQMAERYIPHTPSMSVAPGRRNQNLFGVDPKRLTAVLTAKCIKINSNKTIVFDKGSLSGLAPGNVLRYQNQDKRTEAEIISVSDMQSIARIRQGFQAANFSVNALMDQGPLNKTFLFSDNHTISQPLVKVYIPNDSCTSAQLLDNFEKYYRPLMQSDPDLIPFDSASGNCTKIYMRGKTYTQVREGKESPPAPLVKLPATVKNLGDYFIYLPVPNEIGAAVRNNCLKDQNIELVKSPALSNLSFYCTYSKKLDAFVYVVTDQETTGKKRTASKRPVPYYYFPGTDPKTKKPLSTQQLADQVYKTMLLYASRYGWINKTLKK